MRTLLGALPLLGCAAMCVGCARMMSRRPRSTETTSEGDNPLAGGDGSETSPGGEGRP